MTTATADSIIVQKTRELCQTIVEQPEFQSIRQRIDTFMADDAAKVQYQTVVEKGEMLQHKQQMGLPMSAEEITEFEKNRDALVNNPVARDFLDAQQALRPRSFHRKFDKVPRQSERQSLAAFRLEIGPLSCG